MAQLVKASEIKAGKTYYVITVDDTIETYRVIKRKGNRIAVVSEGGPLNAEMASSFVHLISKFHTRRSLKRYAQLNGLKLN